MQLLGEDDFVDEAASVQLPQSSTHFQARLQSGVLPDGRDQLQAVLQLLEAPGRYGLDDRPSSSSPATLTKVCAGHDSHLAQDHRGCCTFRWGVRVLAAQRWSAMLGIGIVT